MYEGSALLPTRPLMFKNSELPSVLHVIGSLNLKIRDIRVNYLIEYSCQSIIDMCDFKDPRWTEVEEKALELIVRAFCSQYMDDIKDNLDDIREGLLLTGFGNYIGVESNGEGFSGYNTWFEVMREVTKELRVQV